MQRIYFQSANKNFNRIVVVLFGLIIFGGTMLHRNLYTSFYDSIHLIVLTIALLIVILFLRTDYFIADGYIKKTTSFNQSDHIPIKIVQISSIEVIEVVRAKDNIKVMKIYNSDRIIPQATISVKQPERFLKFILRRNSNINVIDR